MAFILKKSSIHSFGYFDRMDNRMRKQARLTGEDFSFILDRAANPLLFYRGLWTATVQHTIRRYYIRNIG